MLFNSFEFIFLFLPVVLFLYYSLRNHRHKLILLLISSYFFYGYWNYKFVSLLLLSTTLDFYLGLAIHNAKTELLRKRLLILSVITNLGILGFFKYFNFFVDNFYELSSLITNDSRRTFFLDIVLPVGISFYTFQSMSYTIDIYYRHTEPHRDFFAFAAYVALFPQLVAGPIVRHSDLVYQLEDPKKGFFNAENFSKGIILFIVGLSKKIILADLLAAAVDPALVGLQNLSTLEAWLCTAGYTLQLYFDFSGYSDMAIGLGLMMNYDFPRNFNSPYKSRSITEFWQRWHISLSTWLRDYLYIPLGGNRFGIFKTYRNLFMTMLLGGFWHGAQWVYVVWGAYHGILLAIERALKGKIKIRYESLKLPLTFLLVMIGWVFFRSPDMHFAGEWLGKMFLPPYEFTFFNLESKTRDKFIPTLIIGFIIVFCAKNTSEFDLHHLSRKPGFAVLMALLFCICLAFFSKNSPFLYFQF